MQPDESTTPEPPITGADLDVWILELSAADRPVAVAVSGLDRADTARWRAAAEMVVDLDVETAARSLSISSDLEYLADPLGALNVSGVSDPRHASTALTRFHHWDLRRHALARSVNEVFDDSARPWFARSFDPGTGYDFQIPPMRLAIDADIVPDEVVPRILQCGNVGSAVIPVQRPPGGLLRRAFAWPLRVGVVDDETLSLWQRIPERGRLLVELSDVRTDPDRVDILLVPEAPRRAAEVLAKRRPIANIVVCTAVDAENWPFVDAHMAVIRAATGAIATVVAPPRTVDQMLTATLATARYMLNGYPIDVALTSGFGRAVIISAELSAIVDVTAKRILFNHAEQVRGDFRVLRSTPYSADRLDPVLDDWPRFDLSSAQLDVWRDRSKYAPNISYIPPDALDIELDRVAAPRLLQVRAGAPGPDAEADNVLRAGANVIDVFIGPEEPDALTGPAFPQGVFSDPAVNSARLTVALVPLLPEGPVVRAELDVPRAGRSPTARLIWALPQGLKRAQARIIVLHRNRVIQTATLAGPLDGTAELTGRLVLWNELNHLDDRSAFDRTIVLNCDATKNPTLITHADGITQRVHELPEVNRISDRIRQVLINKSQGAKPLCDDELREALISAAIHGHDLYGHLSKYIRKFAAADRIQIVAARPGWFLPLEMVYDRPAPQHAATLCGNWSARGSCGEHCFADGDDTSVICPSVFWGLSRVIERHEGDDSAVTDATGTTFLITTAPVRGQRTLAITRSVLAASVKVTDVELKKTAATFPVTKIAATWPEWTKALTETRTDLLVLMPHTNADNVELEISPHPKGRRRLPTTDTLLIRGQIQKGHVTGGNDVAPLVVLFGCDTAGFADDPSGYAGTFMREGAGAVISTLTMLNADHAPVMAQELAAILLDTTRRTQPMGEVMTTLRRGAVRSGFVSALALTAYGDADWKV